MNYFTGTEKYIYASNLKYEYGYLGYMQIILLFQQVIPQELWMSQMIVKDINPLSVRLKMRVLVKFCKDTWSPLQDIQ